MKFELKCCGMLDPIGVDKQNIRLSFTLSGSLEIKSYEIVICRRDSGEQICTVPGAAGSTFVHWADPAVLADQTAYSWQVWAQTADGQQIFSQPGYFETGIGLWRGRWIGAAEPEDRVLEFQKEIHLKCPVKKARLYICGLGYFTPRLNGTRLDDSWFIPLVTDYGYRPGIDPAHMGRRHRITYYTYDVTDLLQQGGNVLQVEVAGGYFSNREKWNYEPQPDFSFGLPCLIYELHIEDTSGKRRRIISDEQTLVRSTNATAQLYSGETVDFTQNAKPWTAARLRQAPDSVMTSPACKGDRIQKRLSPVKSWQTPEGTVYDFGENHTGGLSMVVSASAETELTVGFAEVLRGDSSVNFETAAWHGEHLQTGEKKHIYQKSTYRLKRGRQEITPKFSWFCYRYVLIPHDPAVHIELLTSLFIHMDIEQDGTFACSHEMLNRMNRVFLQTLRCNLHSGLITDCPHRERLPYTGDGKLVMRSACYDLGAVDFYYKWFRDILDAQTAEGLIPNSAPYFGGGGGYAWGNAVCTVSKLLYCYTGDLRVAEDGYAAVVKWIGYCRSKSDEDHIIRSNSHTWMLGDWLAPEVISSDVYYISTVCYLQAVKTALFFAEIIDRDSCERWKRLSRDITEGINRVFFDESKCSYGNGVQGENMLALAEGIVPQTYAGRMKEELRYHYQVETQGHLDTGIMLTPVLLSCLTDHGYRDLAWKIMTAKDYPSYTYLMENDTTFSEHWSKTWPDFYFGEPGNSRLVKGGGELSHCHPMYGSVAAWLYERVAGLDLSRLYQRVIDVRPYFMDCLSWARAGKKTAFGEVRVEWSAEETAVTLKLSVPKGLTAVCYFPAVCTCLTDTQTGKRYEPNQDGYFDFVLQAGQWLLTGTQDLS